MPAEGVVTGYMTWSLTLLNKLIRAGHSAVVAPAADPEVGGIRRLAIATRPASRITSCAGVREPTSRAEAIPNRTLWAARTSVEYGGCEQKNYHLLSVVAPRTSSLHMQLHVSPAQCQQSKHRHQQPIKITFRFRDNLLIDCVPPKYPPYVLVELGKFKIQGFHFLQLLQYLLDGFRSWG